MVLADLHELTVVMRAHAIDVHNGWETENRDWRYESLIFRPAIGAESPLWTPDGVMVGLDQLPLTPLLRAHLSDWAGRAEDPYADHDEAELDSEGRGLFAAVREAYDGTPLEVVWDYD